MSETQSRILEDDELFETLLKLKELASDEAMAVARHIGARSIQRKEIEAERDRLAAEVRDLTAQNSVLWDSANDRNQALQRAEAELSAARAEREEVMEFLCKFINGGVNQEYRTWGRELYLRMYGAASSAESAQSDEQRYKDHVELERQSRESGR